MMSQHFIISIFIKKASDSVDQKLLLNKLKYIDSTESAISWFNLHLKDLIQQAKVNQCLSTTASVRYGVPQGSILRPLMVIIFMNVLPCYLGNFRLRPYADDTAITVTVTS